MPSGAVHNVDDHDFAELVLLFENGTEAQALSHQPTTAPGVVGGQQRETVSGRRSRHGKRPDCRGFQGLSNLPRDLFLGEVLRCAHGADQTRVAAANEVEHADLDVLPGSLLLSALDMDVQPDVWVTGPSVQLLVEAKGFKTGTAFNVEQLPRELLCLQAHSGDISMVAPAEPIPRTCDVRVGPRA